MTQDQERRIKLAAADVCEGETSIGEALRKHFPEATGGDVPPGWDTPIQEALEGAFRGWAGWNLESESAPGE